MTRLQIRQASADVLVITRRGVRGAVIWLKPWTRKVVELIPELLAVGGLLLVTVATWTINPTAGLYAAGVSLGVSAWVVAIGRRPGG